nr:MFS transporter [Aeromicrobium senzhongii]
MVRDDRARGRGPPGLHRREHHARLLLSVGTPTAPRSSWALLVDRRFGPFVVGKGMAFTGVWIHHIVTAVLAWQFTHSAIWVAAVSVVHFIPQVVLAPVIGPLSDRSSRGRLVAYGRVFCIAGTGGLGAWLWLMGEDRTGITGVLLFSLVAGIGFSVSGPAMQAMVSDLVRPNEVGRAVAIDSVPTMFGRAAGPAIGAVLATTLGAPAALGLAALGHVVFGVVAVVIARNDAPTRAASAGGSFRDGLAYIRRNPVVALLLIGVTAVGLGADPVVTLAPAIAHDMHAPEAFVGYIGSAFGVGALLGSAVSTIFNSGGRLQKAPTIGLSVLAAGSLAVPLLASPTAVCVAFFLAGIGFTVAFSGCTAMLHQVVPAEFRGRVMSLWLIAFMGSRPLASVLNGIVADTLGADWAMVMMAIIVGIAAVACLPVMLRRLTRDGVSEGATSRGAASRGARSSRGARRRPR